MHFVPKIELKDSSQLNSQLWLVVVKTLFLRVDRKESVAFDPDNNPNAIPNFHTPKAVNKFGNYTQVLNSFDFEIVTSLLSQYLQRSRSLESC